MNLPHATIPGRALPIRTTLRTCALGLVAAGALGLAACGGATVATPGDVGTDLSIADESAHTTTAGGDFDPIDPLCAAADRALADGAFADAEEAYTAILTGEQSRGWATLHRAVARLARGNRAGAVADANAALAWDGVPPAGRLLALQVLARSGRCVDVLGHAALPGLRASVPEAITELELTCLLQTDALDDAAIRLGRLPDAHNSAGIAAHLGGDVATAEAHWIEALAQNPDDANALRNLGVLYVELGRIDEARPLLERYLVVVAPGTSDRGRIEGLLEPNP